MNIKNARPEKKNGQKKENVVSAKAENVYALTLKSPSDGDNYLQDILCKEAVYLGAWENTSTMTTLLGWLFTTM